MSIRTQCALLNVHRSGFYYCPKQLADDTKIANRISEIHASFPYYGYRKIQAVLRREGYGVNHKKVQRLMREMHIRALYVGPNTSRPDPENSVFPYLLKDLDIVRPNQVWGTDITYIKLPQGMMYLFALRDWYSRFIVGWTLGCTMEAENAIETLEKSMIYGCPDICNQDQGSQFTGQGWIEALSSRNIQISHNGVGRCIDNVRVERLWRSIKYEDVFIKSYQCVKELRDGLLGYITHYNHERPHQALGYRTPAEVFLGKR